MGRISGKVALVTGAARGQGAAEAKLFVEEGASVVLADVLDDLGKKLADELGERAIYIHLDVSDEAAWDDGIRTTEETFGPLDILVNNAAIFLPGGAADATLEDYMKVISVNQVGVFLGMRAAVRSMRKVGKGSIVNVSSTGGIVGLPDNIAYNSSKWAVRGLTKAAAMDLAPDIRVNSLHPGPVDTAMTHPDDLSDEDFAKLWGPLVPLGRAAAPREIATAALFLASDDASFMTGTEVVVDGGRTAGTHKNSPNSATKD
jgi:3alpha(or 20beta)-hydroxysteroid dehydrogenase